MLWKLFNRLFANLRLKISVNSLENSVAVTRGDCLFLCYVLKVFIIVFPRWIPIVGDFVSASRATGFAGMNYGLCLFGFDNNGKVNGENCQQNQNEDTGN